MRRPSLGLLRASWIGVFVVLSSACGGGPKGAGSDDDVDASRSAGDRDGGQGGPLDASSEADAGQAPCIDFDKDGVPAGAGCQVSVVDCDDRDAARSPTNADVCGDHLDNNCTGAVDEGCPCTRGSVRACSTFGDPLSFTPAMRCQAGVQRCTDSVWDSECAGEVGPADETCDGLDQDCDGETDEALRNAIGECLSDNPDPLIESCGATGEGNGLDDDGDNLVDEDCSCAVAGFDPDLPRKGQPCYGGPRSTLGVGACHGGKRDCQADGSWGMCADQVTPVPEICGNNEDDDCDGLFEETCANCTPTGEETCNGVDDDCDGISDEGVLNACGGCGAVLDHEECGNGRDDDCNGDVDDTCSCEAGDQDCYAGPAEKAGVGICALGKQSCVSGEFAHWTVCEGSVIPDVERCGTDGLGNDLDDDCDGIVDEGCGCAENAVRPCGVSAGECEPGQQVCNGGVWSECTVTVGPEAEACNEKDDDCDGLTDEGLLNGCGTCGQTCYDEPFDPIVEGTRDDGITTIEADDPNNPSGKAGITLDKRSFIPPYLWAANHDRDTVSKFNTDTGKEEAIYWVGDNPSRTAVDLDGNVWVGGRNDGRLTKILWDTASCPAGVDGMISTSKTDANGVPQFVNSAGDPAADDCVVFSKVVNTNRTSIRGLAAAPDGRMWIGYTDGGIQSIDPYSFELGTYYETKSGLPVWSPDANGVQKYTNANNGNGGGVYGLVVDSKGHLYTSSYNRNTLARFDTNTNTWVALYKNIGCGSYGIAVDGKDRIWLGGWSQCGGVGMFDPASDKHHTFAVPDDVVDSPEHGATVTVNMPANGVKAGKDHWRTTGVGVEPATGNVWISFFERGYTGRVIVNETDLAKSTITFIGTSKQSNDVTKNLTGVGNDVRGVGFDHNGFAWTLGLGSDRVFKIDPATNARSADMPNGTSVGTKANNNQTALHYTYSDFTGSTALSFTAPRGFWRATFDTTFVDAQVDGIDIEASVSAATTVGVRIRVVDADGNQIGTWMPDEVAGQPMYMQYPAGAASHSFALSPKLLGSRFEVELLLTSSDASFRPVVHDVRLDWQRP